MQKTEETDKEIKFYGDNFAYTFSKLYGNLTSIVKDGKGQLQNYAYLPRLGYEFKIPYENEEFSYFGMGECENYCDMDNHTKIGYYSSNADKELWIISFRRSMEITQKTRLLEMKNSLTFTTDTEFEFSFSIK